MQHNPAFQWDTSWQQLLHGRNAQLVYTQIVLPPVPRSSSNTHLGTKAAEWDDYRKQRALNNWGAPGHGGELGTGVCCGRAGCGPAPRALLPAPAPPRRSALQGKPYGSIEPSSDFSGHPKSSWHAEPWRRIATFRLHCCSSRVCGSSAAQVKQFTWSQALVMGTHLCPTSQRPRHIVPTTHHFLCIATEAKPVI